MIIARCYAKNATEGSLAGSWKVGFQIMYQ